jgi:hypothetical protein
LRVRTRYPRLNRLTRLLRQLELHGSASFPLHDDGACSDSSALGDITDTQRDKITAAQLAIDAEIEQREVA